jgi:hypothetical protein
METTQVKNKMSGGGNNVAANAEQLCFCANRELQLDSSAGISKTAAHKKEGSRIARLPL